MQLTTNAFKNGDTIPDQYAFAKPDADNHFALSENRNPGFSWSDLPAGTQSLALVCIDPDAPSKPDDVNKEDREVPADLPRADFYHWAMVDINPEIGKIEEGECSAEATPGGKMQPPGPKNTRQGVNSYIEWFAGDADMAGTYHGYDGPAPPWNDAIPHRYIFRLLALDIERCPVDTSFTVDDVQKAVQGHVLGQAEIMGTYTLNPRLR